jgi:AcrR family transcriptional regulator
MSLQAPPENEREGHANATEVDAAPRHSGRRSGAPPTRERILTAARRLFAERGYERATIRAIAAAAQVDPALVIHYFCSKDNLLAAALALPFDPTTRIPPTLAGGPEGAGERAVRTFLGFWEDPSLRPTMMAIVRCAASHDRAADLMRGVVHRQVVGPLTRALGAPHGELRATLVASQFIGLAMARYLTRIEPLASADMETVVRAVAPTIQRYLTADLGLGNRASGFDRGDLG